VIFFSISLARFANELAPFSSLGVVDRLKLLELEVALSFVLRSERLSSLSASRCPERIGDEMIWLDGSGTASLTMRDFFLRSLSPLLSNLLKIGTSVAAFSGEDRVLLLLDSRRGWDGRWEVDEKREAARLGCGAVPLRSSELNQV
jgi:hypothetical protein